MVEASSRSVDDQDRIVMDPEIMGGRPVVKGTRIPVSLILNLIAHGYTLDRIVQAYPNLTKDDVRAAILYAGANLDQLIARS